ncbi:chain length determinant protein EpsF [Methylomonas paludis]|uniref:Chain length determinant protein EpsF n=1 Tax=Methylomonas paludis TaxID=1173101 RepID=A0A975RA23_9GAMM|nr:chain length determinant protein EpsF [Methylomonas paludis]QWF71687.1 chain length determinant protein EpsF [Methylomonas paludis]
MSASQFLLILQSSYRIILFTILITVSTALVVSLRMPKSYQGNSSVLINIKNSDPITGMVLNPQLLSGYMANQVDIIKSRTVALKVVERMKLAEMPSFTKMYWAATKGQGDIHNWIADKLLDSYIDVKPSRESSVISVTCTGDSAQFASDLTNNFLAAYMEANLEMSVGPALQQSVWYDEQIQQLRANVENQQKKLSDFQQQTGYIANDKTLDIEFSRLAELSTAVVGSQTRAYEGLTRTRQISNARSNQKIGDLPEVLDSPLIQGLKADLARASGHLAEIDKSLDHNHPDYQHALAEVQNLQQKIDAEIHNRQSSLINSANQAKDMEAELRNALIEQKARLIALKQQRDTNDLLTQDLVSARSAWDSTTLRANQIRLESKRNLTDISVLNAAIPPLKHASPKIPVNIAISVVLGGLLGIGIGFMSAMINRRIHSKDDIIQELNLPLLTIIPAPQADKLGFSLKNWQAAGIKLRTKLLSRISRKEGHA